MRRIFLAFFGIVMLVILVGCETVKGVGRDITDASGAVQGALTQGRRQSDK